MGTVVTIEVVGPIADASDGVDAALGWFDEVESRCTRFDPDSEVISLATNPGRAMPVSDLLLEAVAFALRVAEASGGAFDPAMGGELASRGFDRSSRTGRRLTLSRPPDPGATYRDVEVDPVARTITLHRPLLLDLGAVAKGMAVDLAARTLRDRGMSRFAIDAGGDLCLAGAKALDEPWVVGIRHPRRMDAVVAALAVTDMCVCTSGDYEPRLASDERGPEGGRHIVDPRTGDWAEKLAGVTVVAPSAMVADALGTAAFVLGPSAGLALLGAHSVDGLLVTPTSEMVRTPGMDRYLTAPGAATL